MCLLEPFWNGDFLGTSFQTLFTLNAPVGALFFLEALGSVIDNPRRSGITINDCVVIEREDTRDVHTVGTGHTISATGTGNRA